MNLISKDINLSQSVPTTSLRTLLSLQVPSRGFMKLTHFGNYMDTVAAWGLVTWMIKRNGIGVYPYHGILDQIGSGIEPRLIEPLIFNGGDLLTIDVYNAYAGTVGIGISVKHEFLGD
ncbi:hypothetical protein ES702_06833 [subsurface metagenome]